MTRVYLLLPLMIVSAVSAMQESPSHNRIQVRPKQVRALDLEQVGKKLQAHLDEQEELKRDAQILAIIPTSDELNERCNTLLANANFIRTADALYARELIAIKRNNSEILAKDLAEKLKAAMIPHFARHFKLSYKARYKDWANHPHAANDLAQRVAEAYLFRKPELAILYTTSSCCTIL